MAAPRPPGGSYPPTLAQLPRFSKRPQAQMSGASDDDSDFGGTGGGNDRDPTAPSRSQRGGGGGGTSYSFRGGHSGRSSTLRPSRGGSASHLGRNDRGGITTTTAGQETRATPTAKRGSSLSKRARLSYSDGRLVSSTQAMPPVVIKEEDKSSEISYREDEEDDDDMPRRAPPPAEATWGTGQRHELSMAFRPAIGLGPMSSTTRLGRPAATMPTSLNNASMSTIPVPDFMATSAQMPSYSMSNSVTGRSQPPSYPAPRSLLPASSSASHQRSSQQLPPDHPLKIRLAGLLQAREARKMQWAGLIETLGEEFRNPASHDRHKWMREEQLADEAIAEAMMNIKMAEKGLSDLAAQSGYVVDKTGDHRYRGNHHHGRQRGRGHGRDNHHRGGRGRQYRGHRDGRDRGMPPPPPLHQQDFNGRRHTNFQTRKAGAPTKKPMKWSDERKDDAVRAWLGEMGMPMPEEEGDGSTMDSTPSGHTRDGDDDRAASFIPLGDDDDVMMRGMGGEFGDDLRRPSMDRDAFQRQERSLLGAALHELELEQGLDIEQETLMDAPPVYHYGPSTRPTTLPIRSANQDNSYDDRFNRHSSISSVPESIYGTAQSHSLPATPGPVTTGHNNPPLHSHEVESIIIKQEEVDDDQYGGVQEGGVRGHSDEQRYDQGVAQGQSDEQRYDQGVAQGQSDEHRDDQGEGHAGSDGEGSDFMELESSSSDDTVPANEMAMIEREHRRETERRRVLEEKREREKAMKVLQDGVRVLDLSEEYPGGEGEEETENLNGDDLLLAWDEIKEEDDQNGDGEDLLLAWDDVGNHAGAAIHKQGIVGDAEKERAMDVNPTSASNSSSLIGNQEEEETTGYKAFLSTVAKEATLTERGGSNNSYNLPIRHRHQGGDDAEKGESSMEAEKGNNTNIVQETPSIQTANENQIEGSTESIMATTTTTKASSIMTDTDDEGEDIYEDALEHEHADETMIRPFHEQLRQASLGLVVEGEQEQVMRQIMGDVASQEVVMQDEVFGHQGVEAMGDHGLGSNNGNGQGNGQEIKREESTLLNDLEEMLKGYAEEIL